VLLKREMGPDSTLREAERRWITEGTTDAWETMRAIYRRCGQRLYAPVRIWLNELIVGSQWGRVGLFWPGDDPLEPIPGRDGFLGWELPLSFGFSSGANTPLTFTEFNDADAVGQLLTEIDVTDAPPVNGRLSVEIRAVGELFVWHQEIVEIDLLIGTNLCVTTLPERNYGGPSGPFAQL
jgi:hypothetical protein